MGRLKNTIVYQVGSIDQSKDYGVGWRKKIKPFLKKFGILVIDPTDKPINGYNERHENVKLNKKLIYEERYDEATHILKQIRAIDLRFCDNCSFAIFYLDLTIRTFGSIEEISWINRMRKPILVVIEQTKKRSPGWLLAIIPHQFIFNNFTEMKNYLKYIDDEHNELIEPHKSRWVFFDHTKL